LSSRFFQLHINFEEFLKPFQNADSDNKTSNDLDKRSQSCALLNLEINVHVSALLKIWTYSKKVLKMGAQNHKKKFDSNDRTGELFCHNE